VSADSFYRVVRRRIELAPVRERAEIGFDESTLWIREQLLRRTRSLPEDVIAPTRRGTLRVGGYVGLIDTGAAYLEILPRVSPTASLAEDRDFLVRLLSESGVIPKPRSMPARIELGARHLLEVVIRAVAQRMTQLLGQGVPRRYVQIRDVSPTIRGRIDFDGLARRLPGREHQVPIRYAPLQRDNGLTRILATLAEELARQTKSPESRRLLHECLADLRDSPPGGLDAGSIARITLAEHESQWGPFVEMAIALARGRSPHPVTGGSTAGQGLIFSLDDLFERLLRLRLAAVAEATALELDRSPRQFLLRHRETGQTGVRLRPDYVLYAPAGDVVLVADAKWKMLERPGKPAYPARTDVYQLVAYMLRHRSSNGLLLYPGDAGATSLAAYDVLPRGGVLYVATVDVAGLVSTSRDARREAEEWLLHVVRTCSTPLPRDRAEEVTSGSGVVVDPSTTGERDTLHTQADWVT
jgi:5-methylcytosine-specific restriction enzyme subunit McrC